MFADINDQCEVGQANFPCFLDVIEAQAAGSCHRLVAISDFLIDFLALVAWHLVACSFLSPTSQKVRRAGQTLDAPECGRGRDATRRVGPEAN